MSILIKGMEMPKSCFECFAFNAENTYCALYSLGIPARHSLKPHEKPEWCELIEVPIPHGRLIDADALLESIKEAKKKQPEISDVYDEDYFAVAEWVSYAPTVIESEGE